MPHQELIEVRNLLLEICILVCFVLSHLQCGKSLVQYLPLLFVEPVRPGVTLGGSAALLVQ
ncbi:MAG TPA: hypothetical protein O0X15_02140 [Methanocorpusculum sp.]|nr:hypothetical protein [Methanocorpusculum sp.]